MSSLVVTAASVVSANQSLGEKLSEGKLVVHSPPHRDAQWAGRRRLLRQVRFCGRESRGK
jgi:hypothetical protein